MITTPTMRFTDIDLTKPAEEAHKIIMTISLSQPDQLEFLNQVELLLSQTLESIRIKTVHTAQNPKSNTADGGCE